MTGSAGRKAGLLKASRRSPRCPKSFAGNQFRLFPRSRPVCCDCAPSSSLSAQSSSPSLFPPPSSALQPRGPHLRAPSTPQLSSPQHQPPNLTVSTNLTPNDPSDDPSETRKSLSTLLRFRTTFFRPRNTAVGQLNLCMRVFRGVFAYHSRSADRATTRHFTT